MRKALPFLLPAAAVPLFFALFTGGGAPGAPPPHRPDPGPCAVAGRVVDAAGAPLRFARVAAVTLSDPPAEVAAARAGGDGRFLLRLRCAGSLVDLRAEPEDRAAFAGGEPFTVRPGGRVIRELREPTRRFPEPPGADLGGEVCDADGRLAAGVEVVVEAAGGATAGATTGSDGAFRLRAPAPPPLSVRVAGAEEVVTVHRLPRLDLELFLPAREPTAAELLVHAVAPDASDPAPCEVLFRDGFGRTALGAVRWLADSPWVLGPLPHGTYDVVVRTGGLAGSVTGFHFGPGVGEISVPLLASASVRARLSRRAHAILLKPSATLARLSRAIREADGLDEVVRSAVARVEDVDRIDWGGLPAGSYVLRVLGPGLEPLEVPVALEPGESRDLGVLDLDVATASLSIDLEEGGGNRQFSYEVRLYTPAGLSLSAHVPAGGTEPALFTGLPAGEWFYRVGRILDEPGHTRSIGWHRRVTIGRGESRAVAEDCSWRLF